jgi:2-dehydro-3-deoxyglucarate aldolase
MTEPPSLKRRLAEKRLVLGSWLSFGDPQLAEMMARTGFDFLVVDMEHSATTDAQMLAMIQVIGLSGVVPLVRVGQNDPLPIKRALDAGARGVIVPMISSAEDARAAVSAAHYPPTGTRGVGLSRAQDFGRRFEVYRTEAAEETVVIVQIEHRDAVDALDAILAVDGVDGFVVGPYDLSGSIGKPGKFDDPEVAALLDRATAPLATHAKPGGFHVVQGDAETVRRRLDQGCRLLAYGTEMIFLGERLDEIAEDLEGFRAAAGAVAAERSKP